jgi:YVTN family beta-propeller protein
MTGLSVGSVFAGCRIEAVAGRGGMGVVYKATQLQLDRPVALKAIAPDVALDEAFRERFKHEARLAASIDHPHIVPVYQAGEIDGQLYLVMRWVDGVDLRGLIDGGPPLEPARAARLVGHVASALGAAHAKRLLHRDVKPANILVASVDDGEHAYLTDFGIAKLEQAGTGLTRTGMMIGTVDYMPPERIEGQPGDARSDVYSLGCVLYEMLAGEPPFIRESEGARMYAHMSAEIPWATDARPDVPPGLSAIAKQAMAKKPEDRFQTATEMARALTRGAPTEPSPAPDFATQRTRVSATVPAETLPAAAAAAAASPDTTASLGQPTRATPTVRERRKLPVPLIAAIAAALIAVVAVVALTSGGSDDSSSEPSSSSNGDDGSVQSNAPDAVAIPVPGEPDGLGAGGGLVWVTGPSTGTVSRIDAVSGDKSGKPIPVGADPDSIALDDEAVWVTNKASDTVTRIDAQSGEVLAEIPVGATPAGIALAEDGTPWVVLTDENGVKPIDPESNTPGALVKIGHDPYAILIDGGTAWVTDRAEGAVAHFELPDGAVSKVHVGGLPRALAVEGSSLFVVDFEDRLLELDRESGEQKNEFPLAGQPREMTAAEGAIWVTLHNKNELARFDPATGEITTRKAPGAPVGIVGYAGRIWVGARDTSTVTPFAP